MTMRLGTLNFWFILGGKVAAQTYPCRRGSSPARRLGESRRSERRKIMLLTAACVHVHVYRRIGIPRRVTKPRTCLAGWHGWSSLYGLLGGLRCILSLMGSAPIFHWVHASTYTCTYTQPGKIVGFNWTQRYYAGSAPACHDCGIENVVSDSYGEWCMPCSL